MLKMMKSQALSMGIIYSKYSKLIDILQEDWLAIERNGKDKYAYESLNKFVKTIDWTIF